MRRWLPSLLASVALLCSCSSSDDQYNPTKCSKSDRTGTYSVTFLELSGDCGPLPEETIQITNSVATGVAAQGTSCTTSNERWSENDCKFESTTRCEDAKSTTVSVGVSRQSKQDGSQLNGTVTVDVQLKSGARCHSTYSTYALRK